MHSWLIVYANLNKHPVNDTEYTLIMNIINFTAFRIIKEMKTFHFVLLKVSLSFFLTTFKVLSQEGWLEFLEILTEWYQKINVCAV